MKDAFDDDLFGGGYSSIPTGKSYGKCSDSHPALPLGDFKIYGGACGYPVVKDADIYVALQGHSTSGKVSDPWDEQKVVEIQYSIQDMGTPSDLPRFKKMIDYLCNQLQAGKKIHVGCIGGHGRTGLVLSAIAAQMGIDDAIAYVRKNYCDHAVESKAQVQFLMKHYGVKEAKGYKEWDDDKHRSIGFQRQPYHESPKSGTVKTPSGIVVSKKSPGEMAVSSGPTRLLMPVSSGRNLFKRRKKLDKLAGCVSL